MDRVVEIGAGILEGAADQRGNVDTPEGASYVPFGYGGYPAVLFKAFRIFDFFHDTPSEIVA